MVARKPKTGAAPRSAKWWVYLIRRADGALYTGIALDVAARLSQHESGRGAKALRGRGPLLVVLRRCIGDRSAAQRLEARIKRLPKAAKEDLIAHPRRGIAALLAPNT
jgi:putative endonuclease